MENRASSDSSSSSSIKSFATWAVVVTLFLVSLFGIGLAARLLIQEPEVYKYFFMEHGRAIIGMPLAAAGAFCILLVFEARSGRIEFEALGFKFRGGAGPAVIWVFAFLAIVVAMYILW